MKTQVKGIEIKKAVELAKPFVGGLRAKKHSRPILKAALITEKYVITTDAHRLIRITHNEVIAESRLHHYKKEITQDLEPTNYPQTERLLPDRYNAQKEILVNVCDWLEAHELGLIAAKEHKNYTMKLRENVFSVNAVKTFINKKGKEEKQPDFEQIAFRYTLPSSTTIEKVSYSCEYMIDALKVFKKLKIEQVKLYFYGHLRPMYFVGGDVEIIVLPVRSV